MTDQEDRVLGISEAAKLLAISPTTLRRWAEIGEIHAVVLPSGHRRFLYSEVSRKRQELGFPVGVEG